MEQHSDMVELSQGFAQLSGEVRAAGDTPGALQRIVDLAVKSVDECRYATIATLRAQSGQLLASSEPTGAKLEQLQIELAEGPSWDAAQLPEAQVLTDLISESRWPRFAAAAVKHTEIRTVVAFKLSDATDTVLTMYSDSADGFGDESMSIATIFASQASTLIALLAAEDHSANLETALQSSREIGMALGILMAHRKITNEVAFDLLRSASQNLHRKLRDVASEVMETGTLPDLPHRPSGE